MTNLIFEGDDLLISVNEHFAGGSEFPAIVSFPSWSRQVPSPMFGERFFSSRGIPAVLVQAKRNHWLHTPETQAIIDVLKKFGYRRYFLYGSSMGGYAALMLSRRLGAFASVSLSPQIMILPENAPFESRWQADRKSIKPTFKEEQRINENISRDAWVFLDSEDHLEVPHYQILRDEISQATNPGWKLIDVPFAGHPVSACLQQIGVLEKLIMGLLTGKPPVLDEVRDKCRQAHLEHPKSLLNFLRRCEQVEEIMRYGSGAVSLYERADQRDPEVHYMAAEVFLKLGLMDAALKASSRSLETSPELPHILQKHAVVLDKVHGHSAALEFLAPYLERHVHAGLALQVLQLMKQLGLTTDMHKLEFALKDKLTLTE